MNVGVPLLVDLSDRLVVVVRGGRVAAAKIATLEAGSPNSLNLVIVAPEVAAPIDTRIAAGRARWRNRTYTHGDLDDAWLVVAATSSPEVNAAVADEAERRRVWCIRVDDAESGTAALLGAVRRGPLVVAVSTSGTSPALAARLRADIADRYGPEWGELADLLGALRRDPEVRAVMSRLPAEIRRQRWHAVIDPDIVGMIRSGRRSEAKEVALACLCSSSD